MDAVATCSGLDSGTGTGTELVPTQARASAFDLARAGFFLPCPFAPLVAFSPFALPRSRSSAICFARSVLSQVNSLRPK